MAVNKSAQEAEEKRQGIRTNDPKVVAKILRAMATGVSFKSVGHDVIFNVAANLLDPPALPGVEPLYYVREDHISSAPHVRLAATR